MADDTPEARFLDDLASLTLADLCAATGWSQEELRELIEEGVLAPVREAGTDFSAHAVVVAREALRIRREFALDDAHSVCVVLRFVERVQSLEHEVRALRARIGDE